MKIAHMNKRLEILTPVLNEDSYGGMVTEYVPAGKIWAELNRIDYSEQEKLGTPVNKEQLRFRLRSLKSIQRGWIVIYAAERYIVDVVDNTYADSTTIIVRRYEQGV